MSKTQITPTLEWDEVFDCAVAAWCRSSTSQEMLRMCFQSRAQQNEVSVGWTANELMAFATGIARLVASPTPPAEQATTTEAVTPKGDATTGAALGAGYAEQQAAPKAAPGEQLTREQIREVFMANGFTVKEGQTDLKQYVYDAAHALLELVAAPQQEAQEPCPTCAALARTVMMDQVSFDRKPDCYGIRQITDDEGVEEWEDIRTSPDVAREEANDMMATGRGEIYEVVPLWTTPQPTQAQAGAVPLTLEAINAMAREYPAEDLCGWSYRMGIADAEQHYGIKGDQHGTE